MEQPDFPLYKIHYKKIYSAVREPEIGPFVISTRLLQILAATDIESNVVNDDHSQKKKSKQLSTHQIRAFVFSVWQEKKKRIFITIINNIKKINKQSN